MKREHTLSIMVRNQPGVLTKIAGIFYRQDYNIESITVGKTQFPGISKIVISLPVDERNIELLLRQIENLVDIQGAKLLDQDQSIMMEICLICLAYDNTRERREIMDTAKSFQPLIRQMSARSITIEVTKQPDLIDMFVDDMKKYQILDVSRSGMTALGPVLPLAEQDASL
ncbi:MAG: acetolactate synthase small subunit [Myxococcota bacterium]|nr:acetolactate synthase small subunit [Myxococcota bacterium]